MLYSIIKFYLRFKSHLRCVPNLIKNEFHGNMLFPFMLSSARLPAFFETVRIDSEISSFSWGFFFLIRFNSLLRRWQVRFIFIGDGLRRECHCFRGADLWFALLDTWHCLRDEEFLSGWGPWQLAQEHVAHLGRPVNEFAFMGHVHFWQSRPGRHYDGYGKITYRMITVRKIRKIGWRVLMLERQKNGTDGSSVIEVFYMASKKNY